MRFIRNICGVSAAALIVVVAVGFITQSAEMSAGIKNGISVCLNTLIPALFPFMALCGFLSQTKYSAIIAKPLHPIFKYVFKIPDEAGTVMLMSLIGGYPVGAKGISSLLQRGSIDKKTASRMLAFCVNCGPSFLITAVGMNMLKDKTAGIILFITQTAATLITGVVMSIKAPLPVSENKEKAYEPAGKAFVNAVIGASASMIAICSFAILFSGLTPLITGLAFAGKPANLPVLDTKAINVLISGLLEVTTGCISATSIGGKIGFLLISAMVSFGGISVIFQIISCFKDGEVSFVPYLASRIFHIIASCSLAGALWYKCGKSISVWVSAASPVPAQGSYSWVGSLCIIAMCTILLFSRKDSRSC